MMTKKKRPPKLKAGTVAECIQHQLGRTDSFRDERGDTNNYQILLDCRNVRTNMAADILNAVPDNWRTTLYRDRVTDKIVLGQTCKVTMDLLAGGTVKELRLNLRSLQTALKGNIRIKVGKDKGQSVDLIFTPWF